MSGSKFANLKTILDTLKKIYDPDQVTSHKHIYDKKIIQNIVAPVFVSKDDEAYHDKCPDRWQGEVRKIGEVVTMVCRICDNSQESIKKLSSLWGIKG